MNTTKNSIEWDTQWGVQLILAGHVADTETRDSRAAAFRTADSIDERFGPGTAQLVTRTVTREPWNTNEPGDQWAVRYTWHGSEGAADYVEVEERESRTDAEGSVRCYQGTALIEAVSRRVTYGPWRPAVTADVSA